MTNYDPTNWYWFVAGNFSQLWSSAQSAYVINTDPTYTAWSNAGNTATKIGSMAELVEVLTNQWMPRAMMTVTLTSTAASTLNGVYSISPAAQATISALSTGIAAGKPLPGGGTTFNYADATGTQHAFAGTDFLNFAYGIESYIYNVTQALITLVGGGSATMPTNAVEIA